MLCVSKNMQDVPICTLLCLQGVKDRNSSKKEKAKLGSPKWLELALKELGTREYPGPANNPTVQQYYVDAVSKEYADEISWCAAFVGAMLARSGYRPSGSLLARSYLKWGTKLERPREGCIVIFKRGEPWQGHVAFLETVNRDRTVTVIGGNQDDAVTRARFPRSKIIGYRWPRKDKT